MKKIPTVFKRVYEGHKIVDILDEFTNEKCKDAFLHGIPTVKYDGSCCAVIDGKFYKRYDAKKGKAIPDNAIKCQDDPDPVTGHLPCWVPVDPNDPADKWFIEAYKTYESLHRDVPDGTYEAIGKHFQGNPYHFHTLSDTLVKHGSLTSSYELEKIRSLNTVREFLKENYIEGIVFWLDDEPVCKIKKSDFGFPWGRRRKSNESM